MGYTETGALRNEIGEIVDDCVPCVRGEAVLFPASRDLGHGFGMKSKSQKSSPGICRSGPTSSLHSVGIREWGWGADSYYWLHNLPAL